MSRSSVVDVSVVTSDPHRVISRWCQQIRCRCFSWSVWVVSWSVCCVYEAALTYNSPPLWRKFCLLFLSVFASAAPSLSPEYLVKSPGGVSHQRALTDLIMLFYLKTFIRFDGLRNAGESVKMCLLKHDLRNSDLVLTLVFFSLVQRSRIQRNRRPKLRLQTPKSRRRRRQKPRLQTPPPSPPTPGAQVTRKHM